jgi:hypothetical protein
VSGATSVSVDLTAFVTPISTSSRLRDRGSAERHDDRNLLDLTLPLKFGPGNEPPSVALAHGERREVITMKRAIIFALLFMASLPAVAGIAFADYGSVTEGGIEAPARLDDVQAP